MRHMHDHTAFDSTQINHIDLDITQINHKDLDMYIDLFSLKNCLPDTNAATRMLQNIHGVFSFRDFILLVFNRTDLEGETCMYVSDLKCAIAQILKKSPCTCLI